MMNTDDGRHLALPPAAEVRERNGGGPGWRALAGTVAAAIVWTARPDGSVVAATDWEAATGLPEPKVRSDSARIHGSRDALGADGQPHRR